MRSYSNRPASGSGIKVGEIILIVIVLTVIAYWLVSGVVKKHSDDVYRSFEDATRSIHQEIDYNVRHHYPEMR